MRKINIKEEKIISVSRLYDGKGDIISEDVRLLNGRNVSLIDILDLCGYESEYFLVGFDSAEHRGKIYRMDPVLKSKNEIEAYLNEIPNEVYFCQAYKTKEEALDILGIMQENDDEVLPKSKLN